MNLEKVQEELESIASLTNGELEAIMEIIKRNK